MKGFTTKVYVVQRAAGTIVGVKLTFASAQALAKAQAPAKVIFAIADKTTDSNVPAQLPGQRSCN